VPPIIAEDPITFTCVLEARRETVYLLSRLLHQRRCQLGTRAGARAPGPFKHAVTALRWFMDNTRVRQSAADNAIVKAALVLLHLEHSRPLPGGYPA
jgi:hypothetical protein